MKGRFGAAVVGASLVFLLVAAVPPAPVGAAEPEMCPPTTYDDLLAPPEPTTDTTTPTTDTTTPPTETTEVPGTTVPEPECTPFIYEMTYPLAVRGRFISGFGAERDGGIRLHKGVDLAAPRMTPVVATRSGRVIVVHNEPGSEDCCWLAIRHDDGWESWYIHLNNDTYGSDDGLGRGVRIDLEVGDKVKEGDVLGWLGDSGNAETIADGSVHLHYELRNTESVPVDPWESLIEAVRRAPPEGEGAYLDDDGHLFEPAADALAALGILWSCSSDGTEFCPGDKATPEAVDVLAEALVEPTIPPLEGSYGSVSSIGAVENPAVYLLDKILGCDPEDGCMGVTEAELARAAAAISIYRNGPPSYFGFTRTELPAELTLPSQDEAIEHLLEEGVVLECHLPLDDADLVARDRAAFLMLTWTGGLPPVPCPDLIQPIR